VGRERISGRLLTNSNPDLFGRGFSDNPTYHDHSEHLYISQILCVLSSSPIAWTGNNSFAVIGYSLGGGIAVSFARYFPALVSSLVLIGPSGLVREHHIAWQSYVLYYTEGIIPMCLTKYLVRRRLDTSHLNPAIDIEPLEVSDAEAEDHHLETDTTQACERAVQFQLNHHPGFIDAFISAIRHAPITQQHEAWKIIGQRLAHQRAHPKSEDASRNGLCGAKVVLVLGESDSIIVRAEMEADARDTLGSAGVETLALEGGHDLPIAKPSATTDAIWASWVRSGLVNDAHGSDFTVPI
jgi:pimeloyl-ACP methyl ester carboxylesterase